MPFEVKGVKKMRSPMIERTRRMAIFALLGAIAFLGDIIFEGLPNIHPVAVLLAAYTVVYGWRALIPLYIYVFLIGFSWGFGAFWLPYLYVWLPLFLLIHLIPRRLPKALRAVLYCLVCVLHGLFFGVLWAPAQALLLGFNYEQTVAWVLAGFTFDILHAVGNALASLLIFPIVRILRMLEKQPHER